MVNYSLLEIKIKVLLQTWRWQPERYWSLHVTWDSKTCTVQKFKLMHCTSFNSMIGTIKFWGWNNVRVHKLMWAKYGWQLLRTTLAKLLTAFIFSLLKMKSLIRGISRQSRQSNVQQFRLHINWTFPLKDTDTVQYQQYAISIIKHYARPIVLLRQCPQDMAQVLFKTVPPSAQLLFQWNGGVIMPIENVITYKGNLTWAFKIGQREFQWQMLNYRKGQLTVCDNELQ